MPSAHAQLGGLPPLPQVPSVGDVVRDLPDAAESADAALGEVRRLEIQRLLRAHRRELEADPNGQPIVRSQIIALGMNGEALERARASGFQIVATDDLGDGAVLVTLRAPPRMSTRRALRWLREADRQATYDFDHLHLQSGFIAGASLTSQLAAPGAVTDVRIGLVDTGVAAHAEIDASIAAARAFASAEILPAAHGTAVASLLLGAAPGARIYAADVYGGAPTGGASSALARALSWLASEGVAVINVSLVGPRNRVVETVVQRLTQRGVLIVAAVGNDGPAAPPLYPAAYDGVIGVTGVDSRFRVLPEAGRGPHVDFAATGILTAAAPGGGSTRVRGTSFAAPTVAGLLADRARNGRSDAIDALRRQARDLGARGRDEIYGAGFVGVGTVAAQR
ncbi:MAG TPA: S8 family serine peptidase [Vitreimonas sp.]|uniref:S8 family serine peptidase n=1 Tax=Vitreimonas sp. TaxID=3069702 RepID=UPI002D351B93|nr:S8 family serine peptidase [Vitreimonas sp.]HYD86339.1 S8 family serine peptidase [Vitreimonas sp.]